MSKEDILAKLEKAVLDGDVDAAKAMANEAARVGVDPLDAIENGLAKGVKVIGDRFGKGELFLTDLMAAAEAMKAGLEILKPLISERREMKTLGKVVIGTVAGDIHDIGKSILGSMLFANGFEVYDLGADVPPEKFVEKVKEVNADIVGASALLSTTMPQQREIVKAFIRADLRDKVKIMFGGAPVTEEWVRQIGGDAYAEDAIDAIKVVKELLGIKE